MTTTVPVKLTCIACRLSFGDTEAQKEHYRSDWHRYNLKRKSAGLPCLTQEAFAKRQDAARVEEVAAPSRFDCALCRKKFTSQKTYEQHLESKKHREAQLRAPSDEDEPAEKDTTPVEKVELSPEEIARQEGLRKAFVDRYAASFEGEMTAEQLTDLNEFIKDKDFIPKNGCLFCNKRSDNFENAMAHMRRIHGFFVPDMQYNIDIEGLVEYLGQKISLANICIFCDTKGRSFYSREAVQQHMIDKSHCKMAYRGDEEEYEPFFEYTASYPTDLALAGPLFVADSGELVLPSRRSVGHRSLFRYYRQRFAPEETRPSVLINRALAENRLLGWLGTTARVAESTRRTARDEATRYARRNADMRTRVGMQFNKPLHFRAQMLV